MAKNGQFVRILADTIPQSFFWNSINKLSGFSFNSESNFFEPAKYIQISGKVYRNSDRRTQKKS